MTSRGDSSDAERAAGAHVRSEAARWVRAGAAVGALSVLTGAFGAHGLKNVASSEQLAWWDTASSYALAHALLLGLVGWLSERVPSSSSRWAGRLVLGGVLVFSGTLWTMGLGGPRWLGAVTPIGGVSLVLGWACLFVAAGGLRSTSDRSG